MIDDRNSTDDLLDAAAVFPGNATDVDDTTAIAVMVEADQDGTLYIECDSGLGTWPEETAKVVQVVGGKPVVVSSELAGRQYRVRYVNGGTNQTAFALVTNSHWTRAADDIEPIMGNLPVTLGDSCNLDSFGRLRVSEPEVLIDSKVTRHRKEVLQWAEALVGGGTSTLDDDRSTVKLAVTTSGDKVTRQSRSRAIYQPGRSMFSRLTMIPPVADDNVCWRAGLFDDNDGIFLQGVGAVNSWVVRSSVSGSPVPNVVDQADWNVDGMGHVDNPRNPSGITLDWTKNIFIYIDLQWLSLGRVRVGFDIGGVQVPVHEFLHSNRTTAPYLRNPNQVVRYEIEATDTPGAVRTFEAICSEVESEGGHNPQGLTTPVSSFRSGVAVTDTPAEVIAFRVKAADVDRVFAQLKALSILGATASGNVYWAVVLNPAGLSAGAWISAGDESSLEYNLTRGTGWTGRGDEEHMIDEGYFSGNQDSITLPIQRKSGPGASVAGVADIVSLQAVNATAATSITMFAAMIIDELF